jgi:hypothetical protein
MSTTYDYMLAARHLLQLNQKELAAALGMSERTGERWMARRSELGKDNLEALARLVHPRDVELAKAIALHAGTTLEALGIRPAPTRTSRPIPVSRAVDLVVCAAADALDVSPRTARPAVVAAFRAALELGIDLHDVVAALGQPPAA